MLRHFLSLASGVSEDTKDAIRESGPKLHGKVPKFFQLNDGSLHNTQTLVEYTKEYVSFSYVRHPFER